MSFYRAATAMFALAFLGIGVALVVLTGVRGGGMVGYLIGLLFIALGVGRLYLLRAGRASGR